MSMLPRLKPREFYDLVIEVAIVRPGPIQGGMVHPYLKRRAPSNPAKSPVRITPIRGQAQGCARDELSAFRSSRNRQCRLQWSERGFHRERPMRCAAPWRRGSATARSPSSEKNSSVAWSRTATSWRFAKRCFAQIQGFGDYGFPESHAASFALLVYVSCWLKCHYPDVFACALLNSQPMGFMRRRRLSAMPSSMGSRCTRSISITQDYWRRPRGQFSGQRAHLGPACRDAGRRLWSNKAIRLGVLANPRAQGETTPCC